MPKLTKFDRYLRRAAIYEDLLDKALELADDIESIEVCLYRWQLPPEDPVLESLNNRVHRLRRAIANINRYASTMYGY